MSDPMREYSAIKPSLLDQLMRVEPSDDGTVKYRPCRVALKNGQSLDRVYVVDAESYIKMWGVFPEDDKGKNSIAIDDVTQIESSRLRLPPRLANKMYHAGESGMGYCLFTLVLKDGRRLPYITGNAVDFPNLPQDVTTEMIVDLLPNVGREFFQSKTIDPMTRGAEYYWCLYRKPERASLE
jgi:hypothetical protein